MPSLMMSLVLAAAIAQTPAAHSPVANPVATPVAGSALGQPGANATTEQARPQTLRQRRFITGEPAVGLNATPKQSPVANAIRARQAQLRQQGMAAVDFEAGPAAPRTPYIYTGPGWIKHPLSDAEQIRRYGVVVTPAPRGGEENQPELLAPEVRKQIVDRYADAIRAESALPGPYAPRDLCDDLVAARASTQKYQPIGPAPLGGADDTSSKASLDQNEFWSRMPASGRVTAVACEPTQDLTPGTSSVIIATTGGGLWKSDNSLNGTAVTWKNVSDNVVPTTSDTVGISAFGAIAYAPSNSNIVYAADGSYLDLIEGSGLFRSDDGGSTWRRVGFSIAGSGELISQILVSPDNPDLVYIGYADSLQDGWGLLQRLELERQVDGSIKIVKGLIAPYPDGELSGASVTGMVWTAIGYPLVALDGLGIYLWIDDADLVLPVATGVLRNGGRDFRRVLLASNPAGTLFFATSIGAGGNLVQAVRCSDIELTEWEVLPQGTVTESGNHGIPNAFATYGSLTGFVTINPLRTTQSIIGGVSPYFGDAGLTISDNFRNPVDTSSTPREPSWYEMTRSDVAPISVVPDDERQNVVRGIHPYQNAAAWDRFGNLWIGHSGGVCMVAADKLGTTKKPEYVDKNGTPSSPTRFPTTTAGALNTMLTTASTLSPHNPNRLITGTENNGAGEITPVVFADPNVETSPQNDFISITGNTEETVDLTVDPFAVQPRLFGAEAGPLVYDLRSRLGEDLSATQPPQVYVSAPTLSYSIYRRNGRKTEFPDPNPQAVDPLAPPIEAGSIGEIVGQWFFDRRDNYPPLVAAKFIAPLGDEVMNPKFDNVFSGLITGTSRIWMMADPAQYQNPPFVVPTGTHAKWNQIQPSAALTIEPISQTQLRRGSVTSIGFASRPGESLPDDLRVLWFTTSTGRLCRLRAEVDPDNPLLPVIDPVSRIPFYTQGEKIYPGPAERFALARAADVAVNPRNPNQVYVCFRMPLDERTADGTAIRVARVARITMTTSIDINGNPVETMEAVPVSSNLPAGLTPRTIAVDWGTNGLSDVVYVGTGTGLYSSDDDGVTWVKADPALPLAQVRDIHLVSEGAVSNASASNGYMAVSFYGRGVWLAQKRSPASPADFNRDGFVTIEDFDNFIEAFDLGCPTADLNNDGQFTFEDIDIFVNQFNS